MSFLIQVVLGAVFCFCGAFSHEGHMVDVAVYYESLCQDSINFFTRQLYPSLQGNLSSHINLTLVPYGKSSYVIDQNEIKFTCHHGPAECKGNKIQACALRLIDNGRKSDNLGFNKVTTGFINCLMDKVVRNGDQTQFPTQNCAELNHVNRLADIENCAGHTDASNYLADLGQQTEKINPPLKSVPTILFNGKFSNKDNQAAQNDFVKTLCKFIDHGKPYECLRNSGAALKNSVFATILVALVFYLF